MSGLSPVLVKVCGITNLADATAAAEAGASALGFNFYSRSPRYLAPEAAQRIIDVLPHNVLKVGVFVDVPEAIAAALAGALPLDVVQLHGDGVEYPRGVRIWRALRATADLDFAAFDKLPVEAFLLDTPSDTLPGGTGMCFDWSIAARVNRHRIILAGGLDDTNVRQAIEAVRPWGVDACSRLETSPGRKDHKRMRRFIQAALA
jgi:phosphoribosylanthranilate isomerase